MRIAMVVAGLGPGGLERMTVDLASGLRERGYAPGVFCMSELGVYFDKLIEKRIPVWDCREGPLRIHGLPVRLLALLNGFRPRIIHSQSGTWLPSAMAKWILRYPRLVFTDHGRYPEPRWRALVERWCYRRTNRMVAVSGALATQAQELLRLPRLPEVIHNGVDLELFHPPMDSARISRRTEWGVGDKDVVILAAGRLEPVKNHAVLIEAVAQASRQSLPLRLVILGTGSLEVQLRSLADGLGLGGIVTFLGFRTDVPECMGAADVFALPSQSEGLPVSLLEAMAAGLPVVATCVGGVPEVLGRPPAGILVAPNDPAELARALLTLGADAELRSQLGARAPRQVAKYSLSECVAQYAALYGDVLKVAANS